MWFRMTPRWLCFLATVAIVLLVALNFEATIITRLHESGDRWLSCGTLSAHDVAFAAISGRPAHAAALQQSWMQVAPNALVLCPRNQRAGRTDFIQALQTTRQAFPAAKWLILSDDDTFFHMHNLLCLLESLNESEPVFLGLHHCQTAVMKEFTCQVRCLPVPHRNCGICCLFLHRVVQSWSFPSKAGSMGVQGSSCLPPWYTQSTPVLVLPITRHTLARVLQTSRSLAVSLTIGRL